VPSGNKHKPHKPHKPKERFYLFPGQGGRNYYEKQRRFIIWSCAVAIVFGAAMGSIMWWLSRR
jgi:hypothetical protein